MEKEKLYIKLDLNSRRLKLEFNQIICIEGFYLCIQNSTSSSFEGKMCIDFGF